jgi:citrate lyase subunit beta/citryl-CoA lyase
VTSATGRVANATTFLFVPGDRPDRFAKAATSGADVVIVDLEDAVDESRKEAALAGTLQALGDGLSGLVRINSLESAWGREELRALGEAVRDNEAAGLAGIVVPKAVDRVQMAEARAELSAELALVALIESAVGILNSLSIATTPGVTRLAFGALDYALDIGAGEDERYLDHARAQLVVASRAAGIAAPIDSPSPHIDDLDAVKRSAELGRGFGFGGSLCVHPAQIAVVSEAYQPSEQDVRWAEFVLAADARVESGVTSLDGMMIDRPVIRRAQLIAERRRNDE